MKFFLYVYMLFLTFSMTAHKGADAPNALLNSIASNIAASTDPADEPSSVDHTPLTFSTDEANAAAAYNGKSIMRYGDAAYTILPASEENEDGALLPCEVVALDQNDEYAETVASVKYFVNAFYAFDNALLISSSYGYYPTYRIDLETKTSSLYFDGPILGVSYEAQEIYYANEPGRGLNVASFDGTEVASILDDTYQFNGAHGDVLYFSIVLDSGDAQLSAVHMGSRRVEEIALLPALDQEYETYAYDYIQMLKVCGDRIVLTFGHHEGTGHFFYGQIISMNLDGSNIVTAKTIDTSGESFEVLGNSVYMDGSIDHAYGICQLDSHLSAENIILPSAWLAGVDETKSALLYTQHTGDTNISDLMMYNPASGTELMILSGSALPVFDNFSYMAFEHVQIIDNAAYFNVTINCYDPEVDPWRGHTAYDAIMLVQLDGSAVTVLYEHYIDEPFSVGS